MSTATPIRTVVRSAALAVLFAPAIASAAAVVTNNPDVTTPPNANGGNSDGTGVWFDPLTGYYEVRGPIFPTPLFEDGKYFLVQDTSFTQTEAEVYTEGFFSRGNGVVYASASNLNPARFGDGAAIGPATGYQNPGAGFVDLGPTFGNWAAGGHGYLGLTLRDPTGTSASDIFYGYAEININPTTYATTLLSFAYNNVRNAPITTVSTVPEPATLGTVAAAMLIVGRRARHRSV